MSHSALPSTSKAVPMGDADGTLRLPPPILGTERYPCSVVWTPIPLITWILPFVGHMGICNSDGICHDFAGPFYIGEDNLAFGVPTRYFSVVPFVFPAPLYTTKQLCDGSWEVRATTAGATRPADRLAQFDRAVARTADRFRRTQNYSFFCNNCHSFTACALEDADPTMQFNMVTLAARAFLTGRFVSLARFLWSVLPSAILYTIIGIMAWKL